MSTNSWQPRPGEPDGSSSRLPISAMPALPTARLEIIDLPSAQRSATDVNLIELWQSLYKRKWILCAFAVCGLTCGLLYHASNIPVYGAHATLEVQPQENFIARNPDSGNADPVTLETIATILGSRSIRDRTIKSLADTERPAITHQPSPLSSWLSRIGMSLPLTEPLTDRQIMRMTANSCSVRTARHARILELSTESPDPVLAADFINAMANGFIEYNLEARWTSSRRTAEWLTKQLEDLKRKLETSEQALQQYARTSGLIFLNERDTIADQKLRTIQDQLSAAQADRVNKQLKFEMSNSGPATALPDVLSDTALRSYEQQITTLTKDKAQLLASLTPAHYKVQQVQAQINELESVLQRETSKIITRIKNDYNEAVRRERMLASAYDAQATRISDQAQRSIAYNMLKREVDVNRQFYETVLQKVRELGITSTMQASDIRILDPAVPSSSPASSNSVHFPALGLLSGLFLGAALAILRDYTDGSFKAPGDSISHLRVPELGVIPSASSVTLPPPDDGKAWPFSFLRSAASEGNGAIELVSWEQRPSIMAESFRSTLASLLLMTPDRSHPGVMVVTSAVPGEGKTTCASNLAISIADTHRRVLIIDADMRNPRIHKVFGIPNTWGLSDILQEKSVIDSAPLQALVRESKIGNLWLLTSGPATQSVSHLLFSCRLKELIRRLRRDFDIILIDTPPVLQFSDARVLAHSGDAVVLVLRAGRSRRADAIAAAQRLAQDNTPVIGTILNDWSPEASGHGYYQHYYRYSTGASGRG